MRTRPDKITVKTLPSGIVNVDEAGYLTDPERWSREFAEMAADEEGVVLTTQHWHVIAFMRDYLDEHGIAADARFVLGFLSRERGVGKGDAKRLLFELFPYGYVKQACRIAGMRQPRAWSTG
ncbi:MAG: TusE/DsrC/DsvC family sulfur relay protein [Rhodobacteraceae bacterium]|nr:TusE/DsrC/DsvC family sulfur relay protein [Paracoccaceae bacterium]MCB2120966.1 TusE/DsrC/DsvC family sulfur relay protein [Paracoccaceae bacterium]